LSLLLDVDLRETLSLLYALYWIRDLQLVNVDFEIDSKVVVNINYSFTLGVSDFGSIINVCGPYFLMI